MSLSITLQLVKTLVPTGAQTTGRTINQPHSAQPPIVWAGAQQATCAIEALLVIVNQDVAGPDDPSVAALLGGLHLQGRSCADWIDAQTTVHIAMRTYAEDPIASRALGQQMFRRLLSDQFDSERLTSAAFEDGCGGAGVIIAQWRSDQPAAAITTELSESGQHVECPARVRGAADTGVTTLMSHWSWWAERSLTTGSCA